MKNRCYPDEKGKNVIHAEASTDPRPIRRVRTHIAMVALGVCLWSIPFSASAFATRGRIFGGSFGSSGSGAGQLSLAPAKVAIGGGLVEKAGSGVAVGQATHDVYVADTGNNRVAQFTSEGAFVRAWGWGVSNGVAELQTCTVACQQGLSGAFPGQFETPVYIAVDNSGGPSDGDVYVSGGGQSVVQKFTAAGALIETWGTKGQIAPAGKGNGIAVDTAGNLWFAAEHTLVELDQTGAVLKEITDQEFPSSAGIALDGNDDLYYVIFNEVVKSSPGTEGGYLFGPQDTITGLAVNTATGELYADEGNSIAVVASSCVPNHFEPSCRPAGSIGDEQLSGGAGLAVDSESYAVYAADATTGVIDAFILEPPSSPKVEGESVSAVTGGDALLEAEINPHGAATSYHFEYGPCVTPTTCANSPYGASVPVPDGSVVGADFEVHSVSARVRGLISNTYYHYRVVARNEIGKELKIVDGDEGSFITQNSNSFALLDGRGWELVSPSDKHGSEILPIGEISVIQASAMGDAISYIALASTESEPEGRSLVTQVLSRRAVGGWESQDIAVPHETGTGITLGFGEEYRYFSNDLSRAVVQPFGLFDPKLSIEASEQTALLRTNFPNGEVDSPCLTSCYHPLVTGAPGYENVPSGTTFGSCRANVCGPDFLGASPDLSHVILWSAPALVDGAPESGLYERSDKNLALVSVSPDGQPVSINAENALGEGQVVRNTVSLDGSRVVWSDEKAHLYVRDTVREETVQIGSGEVQFQTASSDVSKVLFTEKSQNQKFPDLLECDIVESKGNLRCEIVDLTSGVLGLIPGASTDAAYVYFVSNAVPKNNGTVVPGAQPGDCDEGAAIDTTCDLYVRHDGITKLVAELSGIDEPDWSTGIGGLVARVSPDGRWLAFMSDRSLTGYDNRDNLTGKPDEEVYLYDVSADGGKGKVLCASCNPTRARPHGVEYKLLEPGKGIAFGRIDDFFTSNPGIAANVPGWTPYEAGKALYQSRYLSDSGRLFFNSSDALVPQDSNGTGDVYEYEPVGIGNCTVSGATFVAISGGCVGLISSGTSKGESAFLDASENGNDVFFLSSSQLSHKDTDSIVDVYDARVGGGFTEPPSPPVCEGDACQSPVRAPEDPTPGSLTYSGPGNLGSRSTGTVVGKHGAGLSRAGKLAKALAACGRIRSKRVRGKCVLHARKRYRRAGAVGVTRKKGRG